MEFLLLFRAYKTVTWCMYVPSRSPGLKLGFSTFIALSHSPVTSFLLAVLKTNNSQAISFWKISCYCTHMCDYYAASVLKLYAGIKPFSTARIAPLLAANRPRALKKRCRNQFHGVLVVLRLNKTKTSSQYGCVLRGLLPNPHTLKI